jgi:hypothetical protein
LSWASSQLERIVCPAGIVRASGYRTLCLERSAEVGVRALHLLDPFVWPFSPKPRHRIVTAVGTPVPSAGTSADAT